MVAIIALLAFLYEFFFFAPFDSWLKSPTFRVDYAGVLSVQYALEGFSSSTITFSSYYGEFSLYYHAAIAWLLGGSSLYNIRVSNALLNFPYIFGAAVLLRPLFSHDKTKYLLLLCLLMLPVSMHVQGLDRGYAIHTVIVLSIWAFGLIHNVLQAERRAYVLSFQILLAGFLVGLAYCSKYEYAAPLFLSLLAVLTFMCSSFSIRLKRLAFAGIATLVIVFAFAPVPKLAFLPAIIYLLFLFIWTRYSAFFHPSIRAADVGLFVIGSVAPFLLFFAVLAWRVNLAQAIHIYFPVFESLDRANGVARWAPVGYYTQSFFPSGMDWMVLAPLALIPVSLGLILLMFRLDGGQTGSARLRVPVLTSVAFWRLFALVFGLLIAFHSILFPLPFAVYSVLIVCFILCIAVISGEIVRSAGNLVRDASQSRLIESGVLFLSAFMATATIYARGFMNEESNVNVWVFGIGILIIIIKLSPKSWLGEQERRYGLALLCILLSANLAFAWKDWYVIQENFQGIAHLSDNSERNGALEYYGKRYGIFIPAEEVTYIENFTQAVNRHIDSEDNVFVVSSDLYPYLVLNRIPHGLFSPYYLFPNTELEQNTIQYLRKGSVKMVIVANEESLWQVFTQNFPRLSAFIVRDYEPSDTVNGYMLLRKKD